ncbi:MAG: M67 family metallopeptidase [Terriglobales bacterium]|jgi:proteasome lid subunit RPN8/RPN11
MLKLSQSAYASLRQHAEETYPRECCGVLLGRFDQIAAESGSQFESASGTEFGSKTVSRIVRCANTRADAPHNRYHIDPRDLIRIQREARERGENEDIVGFYHSHPDHPAEWSPTDLAEAHWFGCSYVITCVEKGKAILTNSFELTGTDDNDKKFVDEKTEVV